MLSSPMKARLISARAAGAPGELEGAPTGPESAGPSVSAARRAVWAGTDDLDGVGDIDEAVLLARLRGPAFDLRSLDFDGRAAVTTDEVVVVLVTGTATVASFTVIAP